MKTFNSKLLKEKLHEVEIEECLIDHTAQDAVNIALIRHFFPATNISELRSKYCVAIEMAEADTKAVLRAEIDRKRRLLLRMIG
jgi:hypothetical protein